jgi:Na+/melibiose symporter-like transporter
MRYVPDPPPAAEEPRQALRFVSLLLALGWLGTNLGYALADLPFKFLLKEELRLSPPEISAFLALGIFTNYIKPLAGILTDSFPLFGTRRRHYLLWSLALCGVGWLMLSLVPRRYGVLLATYMAMYLMVVFISTTLGGVMVEVGTRFRAAGRLTAERIGMFKAAALMGGPLGGYLASLPFLLTASVVAGAHFALIPLFYFALREPSTAKANRQVWSDAMGQLRGLVRNRPLLTAAGMICLIAAAPGFGTPLFFHQVDTLRFEKQFIGNLGLIHAVFGLIAAWFYQRVCALAPLKTLLTASIVIHAVGTLFYLGYVSEESVIAITALEGVAQTLAMLPVYDIAARATPKGSEALGYSVMMSVWNFTNSFSDWSGSLLYSAFRLTFHHLVWLNSGTTLLALAAVPFLPMALLRQRDVGAQAHEDEAE